MIVNTIVHTIILNRRTRRIYLPQAMRSAKKKRYSGQTVLIAEDVDVNREILAALLEETVPYCGLCRKRPRSRGKI